MKFSAIVLGMCISWAPSVLAQGNQPNSAPPFARLTNAVGETFTSIVMSGNVVWDKLAEGQAKDTLQKLATEAATLEDAKAKLRSDLKSGNHEHRSLEAQYNEIRNTLGNMSASLNKFSREIDAAAHPVGESLRVKVNSEHLEKSAALSNAKMAIDENHTEAAIKWLDLAILDLDKMRTTLTCFQDSITRKKPACDPRTLKPIL
jgi:chromosome segregation ATPase